MKGHIAQARTIAHLSEKIVTQKKVIFAIAALFLLLAGLMAETAPVGIDRAIAASAGKIAEAIREGTRVAVINCVSDSARLSEYVVDQLAYELVDSGKLVVVERKDLELVKGELEFQLSGDVSDESAQSIGKMLGAEVIVTASFDEAGVLRAKAIAVETARLLAVSAQAVAKDGKLEAMSDDRKVMKVSTLAELVQAIGPDRVIRLAPGTYDLSEGYRIKNRYVTWVDEFDGPCPVIKSVSNLAFIGDGNATIVIKPAYGWVFSFDTCSGIRISGVTVGHTVPGYCLGGVLRFKNCDDVEVRSCDLYGSGTYGIGLERTSRFAMEGCAIHDCTYGLATIDRSSEISFTDTEFRDTGEYELVEIRASDGVVWTDCAFEGNRGNALFSCDDESRGIALIRCSFSRNDVETFCENVDAIEIDGARFSRNAFSPVGD